MISLHLQSHTSELRLTHTVSIHTQTHAEENKAWTQALFYSCWSDASGHAPVRNTAFLTSHTPAEIHTKHTIPPQSPQFILAHTHTYTHTHSDPGPKCFAGVQPRKPDVSSVGWVYCSVWVCVCVCVCVCVRFFERMSDCLCIYVHVFVCTCSMYICVCA